MEKWEPAGRGCPHRGTREAFPEPRPRPGTTCGIGVVDRKRLYYARRPGRRPFVIENVPAGESAAPTAEDGHSTMTMEYPMTESSKPCKTPRAVGKPSTREAATEGSQEGGMALPRRVRDR